MPVFPSLVDVVAQRLNMLPQCLRHFVLRRQLLSMLRSAKLCWEHHGRTFLQEMLHLVAGRLVMGRLAAVAAVVGAAPKQGDHQAGCTLLACFAYCARFSGSQRAYAFLMARFRSYAGVSRCTPTAHIHAAS